MIRKLYLPQITQVAWEARSEVEEKVWEILHVTGCTSQMQSFQLQTVCKYLMKQMLDMNLFIRFQIIPWAGSIHRINTFR